MKEEWLLLSKFSFKEKQYLLFLNKKGLKFFLEEKNGKYFYPMIDDFLELYKLFNLHDRNVLYLQEKERKSEEGKNKRVSFAPKVWIRRGVLVALTAALTFGGIDGIIKSAESMYKSEVGYENEEEQTRRVIEALELIRDRDGIETFSVDSDGEELDVYAGEFSEPVSERMTFYMHSLKGEHKISIEGKSMDEVKSFMTNSDPSVEECKKAVDENPDIPEAYKKYLHEFIDDVHENIPDFNLSLFYFNIKRGLRLFHGTPEAIEYNCGKGTKGEYRLDENWLIVPNLPTEESTPEEIKEFYQTFYHELAHVSNSTVVKIDDENRDELDKDLYKGFFDKMESEGVSKLRFTFRSGNMQLLDLDVNTGKGNQYDIASALPEGIAEEFANLALGEKVQNEFYNDSQMLLNTYLAIAGVSLEEVLNKGTYFLIEKVKENGIENPFLYLSLNDYLNGYLGIEKTNTNAPIFENNYSTTDLFSMLGEEFIKSEMKKGKSFEEAKERYIKILHESGVKENLPESERNDNTLKTEFLDGDTYIEKQ